MVHRHLDEDAPAWYPPCRFPAKPTPPLQAEALAWIPLKTRTASAAAAAVALQAALAARFSPVLASLPVLSTKTHPRTPLLPGNNLGGHASSHLVWSAGIAFGSSSPEENEDEIDADDDVEHRSSDEESDYSRAPKCSPQHGKATTSFPGSECKVPPSGRPPDVLRRPL